LATYNSTSNSRWKTVKRIDFLKCPDLVPEAHGCYVVRNLTAILYVGSTINLRARLYSGHEKSAQWRSADCLIKFKESLKYAEELMTEARLIRRLRPIQNKQGNPSAGRKFEGSNIQCGFHVEWNIPISAMTMSQYADYLFHLETLRMMRRFRLRHLAKKAS
jgi:hypothetical protein